jgi:hypothetical protein
MTASDGGERLLAEAAQLAQRLAEDIPLSRTRAEHIRVTARANEAENLVHLLKNFLPSAE